MCVEYQTAQHIKLNLSEIVHMPQVIYTGNNANFLAVTILK